MDVRASDNAVGTYTCGSGEGLLQPNQQWNYDATTGFIVSLLNGHCLTAAEPTAA